MSIRQILTKRAWLKFRHTRVSEAPDWLIDGIRICRIINKKEVT